jgi:hypothetical protein
VQPFPIIRRLWYCVAVFTVLSLTVCIICSALTCSPPSRYFNSKSISPVAFTAFSPHRSTYF